VPSSDNQVWLNLKEEDMKFLGLLIPALIVAGIAVPAVFADDDVKVKVDDDGNMKIKMDDDAKVKISPTSKVIKKEVVIPGTVVTPIGEIETLEKVEIKQPAIKIETDD
jgi:hypothetical protein